MFTAALTPFLKWPGGKSGELEKISSAAPKLAIRRFLDPFVGGGSVLFAVHPTIPAEVNDICPELIHLYIGGSSKNQELKSHLDQIASTWTSLNNIEGELLVKVKKYMSRHQDIETLISHIQYLTSDKVLSFGSDFRDSFLTRLSKDLPKKIERIAKLEKVHDRALPEGEYLDNIEGSIRSTFYMEIRSRYNKARLSAEISPRRDADFFFLREYGYASMFRFNAKGEFNIPYGGISYNRKNFTTKVDYLFSAHLETRLMNTKFHNSDFSSFIDKTQPKKDDFLFIDPPYDSDFSEYDGRTFDSTDQHRLAGVLLKLESKIMIVIGDTPLIRKVYSEDNWNIQSDAMLYKWTIKSRNERKTNHLTITNY